MQLRVLIEIIVTDTNGCQQILSDIILNNSSNGLAATAVVTQASGCNELSSNRRRRIHTGYIGQTEEMEIMQDTHCGNKGNQ